VGVEEVEGEAVLVMMVEMVEGGWEGKEGEGLCAQRETTKD